MPSAEMAVDRGTTVAMRQLRDLGSEFRERRLSLGVSQQFVAAAARVSRPRYSRIEAGSITTLSLMELNRIAAVLGLDTSVRVFPGGQPTRDRGQSRKLQGFMGWSHPPLTWRVEVSLPRRVDTFERRAWDAVIFGHGERTAVELEMRLRDVQAMRRRIELKRRDDPTEHFLLLVADTRHNRRVLAEFAELFADLPRLRPSDVRRELEAGRHPGTGLLLV